MKTLLFFVAFNLTFLTLLHATTDTLYPEVGKPCPEFLLKNVNYYKKKEVTFSDFKGKWLILDFWNKYCSACVASFPRTNEMQKKFGDRVQFILIGYQDREGQIRPMYERFQKKLNLILPCAFDSTLSDYWGIYNDPHIIVIDDKGIVQAITYQFESSDLQGFLMGQRPVLPVITYVAQRKDNDAPNIGEQRIPFDYEKPYMINNNGAKSDSGYLFRSVLTKWNQANQFGYVPVTINHPIDSSYPKGMFQVLGVSLRQLYLYAYLGAVMWGPQDTLLYGKYSTNPVLEIKDSSLFQTTETENRFCYSLTLSPEKGTKENLQLAMQRDLKSYFGYDVSIETRKVACWNLIATEKTLTTLASKGGKAYKELIIPHVAYKIHNMPMRQIAQDISLRFNGIVIDKTGITENIDFTMSCMDIMDVKNSLRAVGLDLIQSQEEMKVVFIRDAKKNDN